MPVLVREADVVAHKFLQIHAALLEGKAKQPS